MNAPDQLFIPPHSVEAEQSVLGAILLAGADAFDRIEGAISEGDFYRQDHRQIFQAARTLANAGKPVDVITVSEVLEGAGSLERIGGLSYVGNLAQNTPSAANIKSYAKVVRDRAQSRRLMLIAEEIKTGVMASGANVEEIISAADAAMVQLIDTGTDEPMMLSDAMAEAIAEIDDRATGHRASGLQTGLQDFDAITEGLEPGQLVIVAARPSVGKTALALNIADHVTRQGKTAAVFSLEMTRRELTQRILAMRAGVSVSEQRSGKIGGDKWTRLSECQAKADRERLFLIDRQSIGAAYVRSVARKIKRQHGLALVVVDYLGLMKGEGRTRTEEIGSLSRGLKALAKELQVPIIALAQLNRGVEGRTDKRPMLSDLRDSGEIEQDADIVVMLHREEMYDLAPQWSGLAEVLIRKNRNGAQGDMLFNYHAPTMRFTHCSESNPRRQFTAKPARSGASHNRGGFDD